LHVQYVSAELTEPSSSHFRHWISDNYTGVSLCYKEYTTTDGNTATLNITANTLDIINTQRKRYLKLLLLLV
jgi:hypothetical protein